MGWARSTAPKHELVLIAKKGKAAHTNNVELGKHGRYRTNVWDYAGVNSFGKGRMADLADHPTVKPVALVADAIRDVTRPGEIVLDAFMGSGTTILAAERTKRRAYGIEIEPGYIDVAIRRWAGMTGEQAVLAETGEVFAEVAARRDGGGQQRVRRSAHQGRLTSRRPARFRAGHIPFPTSRRYSHAHRSLKFFAHFVGNRQSTRRASFPPAGTSPRPAGGCTTARRRRVTEASFRL